MLCAVLIILLFIHLDEELVRTECCGALQLIDIHRGSSHLPVRLGVICYCCWYLCLLSVYPLAATPLFPHVSFLGARFCLVLWSICHEIEQLHLPIYRFAERRR